MNEAALLVAGDLRSRAAEGAAMERAPGVMAPLCAEHVGLMNDVAFFDRTVDSSNTVLASSRLA